MSYDYDYEDDAETLSMFFNIDDHVQRRTKKPRKTANKEKPKKNGMPKYLLLNAKQRKVIRFVRLRVSAGHEFPTLVEISEHMGWKSSTSARDCLQTLVIRRCLTRQKVDGLWRYHILPVRGSETLPIAS